MIVHFIDEARNLVANDLDGDRVHGSGAPLENKIAEGVDCCAPARIDDRRGVELFDDAGPLDHASDIEPVAFVKGGGFGGPAVETHPSLALARLRNRTRRGRLAVFDGLVFGNGDPKPHAVADDFHRSVRGRMAMNLRVALIEAGARRDHGGAIQAICKQPLEGRAQFIALACIAQIEFTRKRGVCELHPLGGEFMMRTGFKLGKDGLGVIRGHLGEGSQLRADVVVNDIRAQKPEC